MYLLRTFSGQLTCDEKHIGEYLSKSGRGIFERRPKLGGKVSIRACLDMAGICAEMISPHCWVDSFLFVASCFPANLPSVHAITVGYASVKWIGILVGHFSYRNEWHGDAAVCRFVLSMWTSAQ